MRMTSLFATTLHEDPATAELISHKLMLRAGLIKVLASGIYTHLPLGNRVIQKICKIVREEMDKIGGQEVILPILHPAEIWQETKRWDEYGEEMFKFTDRKKRHFGLGPTHEEVITDLVRREVKSYRQLPLMLYQIQTKFRDEIRPRFGVMRAREFIMKDAYSFHVNEEDLDCWYKKLYQAYSNIFTRCGFNYIVVEADPGLIGGFISHEFMVISDSGEEPLVICKNCGYADHLDQAISLSTLKPEIEKEQELQLIKTPNLKTVQEVSSFLKIEPSKLVKTLIYETNKECVAVLIPGNEELNEKKLQKIMGRNDLALASKETIEKITNAPTGYAGPIDLNSIRIIADNLIKDKVNVVVGANKADAHYINANIFRDFKVDSLHDLRKAKEGDNCAKCGQKLQFCRGIEIGHIFKLGKKYSQAMRATYRDEDGREKVIIMGCYGIGISRMVAASIEQNHDKEGIIWPKNITPYQVLILPVNVTDLEITTLAEEMYNLLREQGFEVLIDDRNESPGRKFKDADLIGFPVRITIGNRIKKDKKYELVLRNNKEKRFLDKEKLLQEIHQIFS